MSRRMRIGGNDVVFDGEPPAELLTAAFSRREHPLCMCCPGGCVDVYRTLRRAIYPEADAGHRTTT